MTDQPHEPNPKKSAKSQPSPAKPQSTPPSQRKPTSTALREAINQAKREGWWKWIRQGEGEEADERAILNGCTFDLRRVDHWTDFADEFGTLTEGAFAGKPFRLLDWQVNDTGRLFGWTKYSIEWQTYVRRFRFWYEEVSKKNGKTPLLSLVGNYLFFADCVNEDGSYRQINLFLTATTKKQAERCLKHAARQIEQHPDLARVAISRKLEGFLNLQYLDNEWTCLAANAESADGVNGHCLADEFHRWKCFEFYHALKWMLASQPEGVFAAITTAGETGENVCRLTHEHARDVNSGRVLDEQFLGVIYGASKDDDPHDEKTWFKANPSLGTDPESPIKLSTFRSDYQAAVADPSEWAKFRRLRLGMWDAPTAGWIATSLPRGIDDWDSGPTERQAAKQAKRGRIDCYQPFTDQQLIEHETVTRTMALDLASVRDTVAAVCVFADEKKVARVRPFFWLPKAEAERQKKRIGYLNWAQNGHIKLTDGAVIDFEKLAADLIEIIKRFKIERFYYDGQFQAEWLPAKLEQETEAERVQFPQTILHYGPVVKDCERRIISHTIRHNANPVLTWQMQNAVSQENVNGDKRIIKRKKGSAYKVDGVQAMLMALRDTLDETTETGDEEVIEL